MKTEIKIIAIILLVFIFLIPIFIFIISFIEWLINNTIDLTNYLFDSGMSHWG